MQYLMWLIVWLMVTISSVSATVFLRADYETGNFNQGPTQIPPQFCCPHSAQIVTSPKRGGNFAARYELRHTDVMKSNQDPGVRTERIYKGDSRVGIIGGASEWYAFSIFLPSSWLPDGREEIIAQWHNTPDPGEISPSPPLALLTNPGTGGALGKLRIAGRYSSTALLTQNNGTSITYYQADYETNVWIDWLVHVRWSCRGATPLVSRCQAMPTGFIEVWKNGTKVVDYEGPNCYNDTRNNYFQWGIYKPWWTNKPNSPIPWWSPFVQTRILYNDELRIGSTRAEVEIGGGTPPPPPPEDMTAPSAPTNLQLSVQSESSIQATWGASTDTGGSGLAGYNRYLCAGSGCTPGLTGTGGTTSHLFVGLQPATLYRIQIAAVDGEGNVSTRTAISQVTTPTNLLRVTNHIANSGNFASDRPWQLLYNGVKNEEGAGAGGQTSFFVEHDLDELKTLDTIEVTGDADGTWLCGNGGVGGGFTLEYKALVGDAYTTAVSNANCRSNSTITHDLGDVIGRYVKITISCLGCAGVQAEELLLRGSPAPDVPVPGVPTGFVAQVQSATEILYTWNATAGAENYRLYLCAGVGCTPTLLGSPEASPFLLDVLAPDTLYRAQLSAVNIELEESAKTTIVSAETLPDEPDVDPPPPPPELEIVQSSINQLELLCDISIVSVAGYRFRRCDSPGCDPATPDAVLESPVCNLTDTGLRANRTYYYEVSAFDGAGNESDPSPTVSGITAGASGVTYGAAFQ